MNKIMYIFILDEVDGNIPLLVANSILEYHKIYGYDEPGSKYDQWFFISTKKEIITVNSSQFTRIANLDNLDNIELFYDNEFFVGQECCAITIVDNSYDIDAILTDTDH